MIHNYDQQLGSHLVKLVSKENGEFLLRFNITFVLRDVTFIFCIVVTDCNVKIL